MMLRYHIIGNSEIILRECKICRLPPSASISPHRPLPHLYANLRHSPNKMQTTAGITLGWQSLTLSEPEQLLLDLPTNWHLFSYLSLQGGFLHGPDVDCINDFRCKQHQPKHSDDKRGFFFDGHGQIGSVPICPRINQRLPAERPY